MAQREIKIVSFVWHKKGTDYNGDEITQVVDSKMGETVDLPDNVIAYGESMGAFVTPEDEAAEEAAAVDVTEMGEDELVNWVSEHTVPEVVAVAKSDPELVDRLLAAENTGTGNDPRTSLVEGLAQVSGSGEAPVVESEGEQPTEPETAEEVATRLKVDIADVEADDPNVGVTVDDVKTYYDEEMADATDGAIKLAEEKDVYLADITGSGEGGRIEKPDVQKYLDAQEAASA